MTVRIQIRRSEHLVSATTLKSSMSSSALLSNEWSSRLSISSQVRRRFWNIVLEIVDSASKLASSGPNVFETSGMYERMIRILSLVMLKVLSKSYLNSQILIRPWCTYISNANFTLVSNDEKYTLNSPDTNSLRVKNPSLSSSINQKNLSPNFPGKDVYYILPYQSQIPHHEFLPYRTWLYQSPSSHPPNSLPNSIQTSIY